MILDKEQEHAATGVVAQAKRNGLSTLGGYAGTGKTAILCHLATTLGEGWKFVAYTGKAASNLRKKGVNASTIHSTIYSSYGDPPEWELKHINNLEGFAIDEASMVGQSLLDDLKSFGKPIIAVGDHGQLPPVGDSAGLMKNPEFRLEKIHRNSGQIAEFAQLLREDGDIDRWSNTDQVKVIDQNCLSIEILAKVDQVITAYNYMKDKCNNKIREYLKLSGEISVGDKIIVLKNNKKHNVFNGQQGIVTALKHRRLVLDNKITFPYTTVYSRNFDLVPIDFAYCLTCHKVQGDEFDSVVVLEDSPTDLWAQSQWNYTAASRAKKTLLWVKK